jgi:hypothetical protein
MRPGNGTRSTTVKMKQNRLRLVSVTFTLAFVALASDEWVIFKGQVNGPVESSGGINLSSFALKRYPGFFWTEGYYHHMNFPDGSMITVSIGFNRSEANIAFIYGRPGMKPFNDYIIKDFDDDQFDDTGFGFTIDKNRVRLDGNKYTLKIELPKTRAKIEYDILGSSYTYGDGMVRYPDGDTFMFYSLPVSWARVQVDAVLDGRKYKLEGSGNMNHDAGVIFPAYIPYKWQVFWFFGEDHALAVTDHYTHHKFGKQLTQRLVFIDKEGRMFTSTSFILNWDNWVDAEGIPFRYPRDYTLIAEGLGAKLEVEVRMKEVLLLEDLYSNLPKYLRIIAERFTPNGWTMDSWSDYIITYRHEGQTDTYQGRGIVRWMDLEEEKE